MTVSRRDFLKRSAIISGAASLGLPTLTGAMGPDGVLQSAYRPEAGSAQVKPLRILFLGGTGFTGPHQVEYATSRGHKVTLFNRGRNTTILPNVPRISGDRNTPEAFKNIGKESWDVVIDIPTSNPKWVRDAGNALKDRTPHYIFVSTISVFNDNSKASDENGSLFPPADVNADYNAQNYGANKVASEVEAAKHFKNVTIVRPGLIVGPGDNSDRFTYWPVRIEKGGEILAPGNPNDPVQYVDARDLAQWIVRLAENKVYGTFNATGPAAPTNIAEMLYGIRSVTTKEAKFIWVDADFLQKNQVRGWSDMPVWVNPVGRSYGFSRTIVAKAVANGLTFRPLADTAKDTLDWYHKQPAAAQAQLRSGIAPDKEKLVIAAWKEAKGIK